ncbi:MAG: DUF4215 domain-containing protein [Myxococcales bacterium]|jgi:cysteine-rich repeat protein
MSRPWRLIPLLAALALAACGDDPPEVKDPVCGNGAVESGEVCDDGNTADGDGCRADCKGTETCGDGIKDVGEVCDDGNTNSGDGCRADCKGAEICGDSLKDPGEECDQGAGNSDTKPDACRTDCKLPRCGDGVKDTGEGCDEGENNNDTAPSACRTNCVLSTCGDGVKDQGEQCDNGPDNNDDVPNACRTSCLLAFCGDGVLDDGEACDNGVNNSDTEPNACRTNCKPASCGDGVVDTGEACDDGANNSDSRPDACRTNCTEPTCGDGTVDTGEQCDDGDDNSDTAPNACREDCVNPTCGDSVRDNGEDCDDGLANSDTAPNACRTNCKAAGCGDGVIDSGEACDNGQNNSDSQPDACRTSCAAAACGDGVVDSNEACDDGQNNSDTTPNACRSTCTLPICGDGVTDDGEDCDDANAEINDGCTPTCKAEIPGESCAYYFDLNASGAQSDGTFAWSADTSVMGSNLDASCSSSGGSPEGIARFVAPADGVYAVSAITSFDGVLWAWKDTCPSVPFYELGCADEAYAGEELLTFTLTQGQAIFLVVDGYGTDSAGEFTLTLAPLACGDGIVAPTEECDDNNDVADDGCTACEIDDGWACPAGEACRPIQCGDGHIDPPETCDDNNDVGGDGCSATCQVEIEGDDCTMPADLNALGAAPWTWSGDTSALNANYDADAVDSACAYSGAQRDAIGAFTAPAAGDYIFALEAGFDSVLFVWDVCDTAAATSLGCADVGGNGGERITLTLGDGQTVFVGVDGYGSGTPGSGNRHGPFTLVVTPVVCGDGLVAGPEACDDNNTTSGDGCSETCQVEDGYACPPTGGECYLPVCGDGTLDGTETCDDGNNADNDGCSATCQAEIAAPGSTLQFSGSLDSTDRTWVRRSATCGAPYTATNTFFDAYAIVNNTGAEQQITITANWSADGFLHLFRGSFDPADPATNCVLGNDDFGDRFASRIANQTIAAGETLVVVASTYSDSATGAYTLDILTIREQECGDGYVDSPETCDDNNQVGGDGCSETCAVEAGYICPATGGACHQPSCGDGTVEGDETCDDNNQVGGDGCSEACAVEAGYICPPAGGACHMPVCGDGTLEGDETCDDGNTNDNDGCTAGCLAEIAAQGSSIQLAGSLDATDRTWSRPGEGCTGSNSGRYFDSFEIVNNTGTDQQITITAQWSGDGFLHLFRAPFDATDPETNCVIGDDDFNGTSGSQIPSQTIAAGEVLVVVASTYGTTATGAYTLDVLTLRAPVCGDGQVDPPETCDDGNQVGGDGCSATCALEGDDCSAPFVLNSQSQNGPWTWSGDTSAFTADFDADAVNSACAPTDTEPDGIASFTAPADGDYLIELDANFDSVLFVWDACDPATATSLGCHDTYGDGGEHLTLTLTAGQTVFIGVDGYAGWYAEEGPFTLTVTPLICGDGALVEGEACDDGNAVDGDGCTACQIDEGWVCPAGEPCHELSCGDGIVDAPEKCDDGNATDGDGCTGCVVDAGWICEVAGQACRQLVCGDGVIETGESCEDGNQADGDGCSASCILEIPDRGQSMLQWGSLDTTDRAWNRPGANCATGSSFPNRFFDEIPLYNGTGVDQQINVRVHWSDAGFLFVFPYPFDPNDREACVHGVSSSGFNSELLEVSIPAGEAITLILSGSSESAAQGLYALEVETIRPPECGDGLVEGDETCDDGQTPPASGDGCSETCQIEQGWVCETPGSACERTCGNGVLDGNESCDDGGLVDGDGCSAACVIEIAARGSTIQIAGSLDATDPTWSRANASCNTSTYTPYFDAYEIVNNTGVDQKITISAQWTGDGFLHLFRAPFNPSTPTVNCIIGHDGYGTTSEIANQTIAAGETLVVIATSYYSRAALGAYTIDILTIRPQECGDGFVDAPEVCDDGNADPDDGCSADCRAIEPGFVCETAGAACRQIVCGDSIIDAPEVCDDGNANPDDGCAADCRAITDGYVCPTPGSDCRQIQCGDSFVDPGETCDDGNLEDGDGCSAFCELEIALPSASITLAGSLDATDPQWARPGETCGSGTAGKYYDAFSIVNNTGAAQLIDVIGTFSGDGFLHLWRAPFNPASPDFRDNCIKGADNERLTDNLINDGEVLVVVASAYYADSAIGSYSINITTKEPVCGDGKVTGGEECDGGEGCTDTCQFVTATPFEATFSGFDALTEHERGLVTVTAKAPSDIDPTAMLRWRMTLTDASQQPVVGALAFYYAGLPTDVLEDHLSWTASITTDENGQAWFGPATGFTAEAVGLLDPEGTTTPMSVVLPSGTLTLRLELVELAGQTAIGEGSVTFTVATAPQPGTLIFSEYVEGGGNNKAFEVFNASDAAIELSACVVNSYVNGGTAPQTYTFPSAVLDVGEAFVVCHSSIADASACDDLSGAQVLQFNGDDALELVCGDVVLDVIGQVGTDPGTAWTANGVSTANQSLRRKCGIATGDADGSDGFDPSAEWVSYPQDTLDGLGSHQVACP